MISIVDEKKHIGQLLMKAKLTTKNERREIQKPGADKLWYFFSQIVSGFELAPEIPEEELVTHIVVEIGQSTNQRDKKIKTHRFPGRFPLYKQNDYW